MADEEFHYPPGSEGANAAEEAAKAQAETEAKAADEKAAADATEKATAEDTAKAKAEAEAKAKAEEEAKANDVKKPRSIYEDFKEKKQEAKEANARAEAAEARAAELQALLESKDEAKTPKEKAEAESDIEAFAKKQNLDPAALDELTKLILSRVPKVEMPEGLSKEEIDDWRASRATARRDAEDRAVMAESSKVKEQLGVHNDAELQKVMDEVVRLSHTDRFHDKEVGYIVWANQEALSKLVSPKKASFEAGGDNRTEGKDEPVDFSSGKGITPGQAQQAMQEGRTVPGYEIRRS